MRHYGDITKLSGYDMEPVDVITGGSPCQDLSVAGKRGGMSKACPVCGWKSVGNAEETVCPKCGHELEYTRSGLFMEQVRIIKEMRQNERDHGRAGMSVRPRYCIWENVPGVFSSNDGKDFQAVLSEFVRIADPDAPDVPMPEKGGWPKAGCLYDQMGGWSLAWNQHDAQYHGVPQRRKRVCVLADFNGLSAGNLLFGAQLRGETEGGESVSSVGHSGRERRSEISAECESLSGNPKPGRETREGTAPGTESGADRTICIQGNGIDRSDSAGCNGAGWRRGGATLSTPSTDQQSSLSFQERAGKPGGGARESSSSGSGREPYRPSTISPFTVAGFKHKASPAAGGVGYEKEKAPSLLAGQESSVCYGISSFDSNAMKSPNPHSGIYKADTARTLDLNGGCPACNQGAVVTAVDCRNGTENPDVNGTLQAKEKGGQSLNLNNVIRENFSP